MLTGGVMSAIGAYYQAENQKLQLKSQASAADFASRIAGINARNAEADAQFAIEAGRREAALYSLRAAQQRAATTVSLGARGIQAGVGSAAEVQASNEIAKRLDLQAIDTNTLRQSQAIRRQAVNERQQAMLGNASARNLRASARSIQPWAGAAGHGHGPHERGLGAGARFRLLEVLSAAADDARLGISEIAEAVGVDQPRASRLVADATSRGLMTRSVDPLDARKSVVAITDAGRALLTTVRQGRRTAVTDALAGFTDEEVVAFASLLSRFAAAWPRH